MYKKNTYSWLKHWDFTLVDILCMELAFWAAVLIRSAFNGRMYFSVYTRAAVVLVVLNICVVFFYQSYKSVLKRDMWEEFGATAVHCTCIVVAMLVYIYMVMQQAYYYSRTVYVLFWLLYLLFTTCGRYLLKGFLHRKRRANKGSRMMLLIVWEQNAEKVTLQMQEKLVGDIRLSGVAIMDGHGAGKNHKDTQVSPVDDSDTAGPETPIRKIAGVPVVAEGEETRIYIKENWVDEVFICPPADMEVPHRLRTDCASMGITTHVKVADTTAAGMHRVVEKLGGYTVLTESLRMASPAQAIEKRLMDIIGGAVGLVVTGIAFLFVAPAIKIASPGPVFFSQTRVGKNGKLFKIYKFRSMYVDADAHKQELQAQNEVADGMMFKIHDDPRIIRGVGHFIRRTSIDELPQFWNVMKGDMSLVGTRPPTTDEWKKYAMHHRRRMSTRPGITGMWQVSGRSDITDFEEVVRLDTEYIQNWSVWLDVKILVKTIGVVLSRKGSE